MDIPQYDLSYCDFSRLDDSEYAKEKHLKVKTSGRYRIVKYDRTFLNSSNINTLGRFRSIIVKEGKIRSFAPPKASSTDGFYAKYSTPESFDELTLEEYVEGTMINVFYDTDDDDWIVASRSLIGANGQFYQGGKTFRRMFLEAMNNSQLELSDLNTDFCYSFVFQHPENRIVKKCKDAKLYLCAMYFINPDNSVSIMDYRHDVELCKKVNTPMNYSNAYPDKFTNWDEVCDVFANMETTPTPYDIAGVVVHHRGDKLRSKIRNPNNVFVRELRGNQPKLQFQYYCLRQTGRVGDYLRFYPEHADEFSNYRKQLHSFTNQLHVCYLDCYARKTKPLREYPYELRTHMFNLHKKYIDELRPDGKCVTMYEAMSYVNTMPPAKLMFTMNYKLRKQNVDDVTESRVIP